MPTDAKLFHNNIQIFQWYEKWFILIQFIYLVVFHQYRNIFGFPQSFGDKIVLIMFMLKFLNDLLRSIYFIFFLHQTNDLINLIILIKLLVWLSCFILQCALLHDDDMFFFAFNLFKYRTKLICLNCKLKFVYPCSLLYSLFLGNWFFFCMSPLFIFLHNLLLIHSVFSSIHFEKFKRIDKMFVCMFQCRNQSSKWPFFIVN